MAPSKHSTENGRLQITLGSITLSNPTILASGVLGVAAGGLIRAWQDGAAAVVSKTTGLISRMGHPGPRVVGLYGDNLMNAMGIPNPGITDYLPEVQTTHEHGAPVIGSALGNTPEEFAEVAEHFVKAGAVAVELNVSCPHVGSLYLLGMDPISVSDVVKAVRKRTKQKTPVWVKLPGSTDYPRLVEVARAAETAGADALVIMNTLPALAIDPVAQRPLLGAGIGGLSGPAIKPIALRAVWEIHRAGISIPVIGVGGIFSGSDVIEFVLAGASAVEIGTGVLIHGTTIFRQICDEILEHLKQNNIDKLSDLIGQIHDGSVES